ncbi:Ribbon-helix-helix protein, copG family [Cylindrospermum stagnale PCC 7417]|uniref:Ribbon-helix-helix protein, copG family n=1 Tax=Cylindrospermum stagnale PCC 7417 TaxID=56107 RepID=K9X692_9NOST|nr:Ribbon-helix-helix protein, copG family [Cylindrospermum stagnale PCC 7417]
MPTARSANGFAIYYYCNGNIITMQMVKVNLNVRLEQLEMEILEQYAKQTGRTKTDIIREYIRNLNVHSSSPNNTD